MKLPTLCALIAALWLVGCATAAQPTSTPTLPPPTATYTPQPTQTLLDETAERGRVLFWTTQGPVGFACATCHYATSEQRLIGPGLRSVSVRVTAYNPEDSVEAYLRRSILEPDAFVAPGPYKAGLMPHDYSAVFGDEQLDDLIAYLLTL